MPVRGVSCEARACADGVPLLLVVLLTAVCSRLLPSGQQTS
ncbi:MULTISPECIES: hypothetical protein [unclassified Streptomyces]|nr:MULTISPECIES: hypothetical protein [unclassified Streptomyces]